MGGGFDPNPKLLRHFFCHFFGGGYRDFSKARFFWFFLYLIDLRNNAKEKKLRFFLDPRSQGKKSFSAKAKKRKLSLSCQSTPTQNITTTPIHATVARYTSSSATRLLM